MADEELKDLEDAFDANNDDDMADFMSMLDSIDDVDESLIADFEDSDTEQIEEQLDTLADDAAPFSGSKDFLSMSDEELKESGKKVQDMMSELGLGDISPLDEPVDAQGALDDITSFVPEENTDILNILDSVGDDSDELSPMDEQIGDDMTDDSVGELVDFLADFQDGSVPGVPAREEAQEETVAKKGLFARIKEFFHKEPTEEERLAQEQEEEEERAWEEQKQAEKEVKKQEKAQKKAAKQAEAEQKKQQKAEQDEKKQQQKAAKQAEKAAEKTPVPKSQLVPVKPLLVFVILGVALSVVFIVFSNYRFYNSSISESKEQFIHQHYREAYEKILGLDIKKKDETYFEQAKTMRIVDKDWEAYNNYIEDNDYEQALDSLIKGMGKYNVQYEHAEELKLEKEMRALYEQMLKDLTVRFGLTAQDASNLYEMKDRNEYQKQISQFARDAAIKDGVLEPADTAEAQ